MSDPNATDDAATDTISALLDRVAGQRRPSDGPGLAEACAGDLPYATPTQAAAIEAMIATGSVEAAADSLGLSPERLRSRLAEAQRRAARRGHSPEHDTAMPVPPGFHLRGTSTLYGRDGAPVLQWVKTAADQDHRLALLLDAIQEAVEPIRGLYEPGPVPDAAAEHLRNIIPWGDPHLGMYAWADEAGADFDLVIAERELLTAHRALIAAAEPAEVAHIINVGDYFHADNPSNQTSRSGHALDVDTRFARVYQAGVRMMRLAVEASLDRHQRVIVTNVAGNHDDVSAITLSVALAALYEREPRVTVEVSPARHHYYRHGACMYGATHGHQRGAKLRDLGAVMATDRPEWWGATRHRRWYTGHIHQDKVVEVPGCIVESVQTLAPRDAYAAAEGYRSGQSMRLDTVHSEWGWVQRITRGIDYVRHVAAGGEQT